MPEKTIANMSGISERYVRSSVDHSCRAEHMARDPRFAGMSESDMRKFLKEEQEEGMHPSLKGKRF
jgi:hypothetical protein